MWICIDKCIIYSNLGSAGNKPATPSNNEDDFSKFFTTGNFALSVGEVENGQNVI
jgi:hypothetical protein